MVPPYYSTPVLVGVVPTKNGSYSCMNGHSHEWPCVNGESAGRQLTDLLGVSPGVTLSPRSRLVGDVAVSVDRVGDGRLVDAGFAVTSNPTWGEEDPDAVAAVACVSCGVDGGVTRQVGDGEGGHYGVVCCTSVFYTIG